MPDGNLYGLLAMDDINGLGVFPTAMPLCPSRPRAIRTYVCLATQEAQNKLEELSSSGNVVVRNATRTNDNECQLSGTGRRCELTTYPSSSNSLEVANQGEGTPK
jgi:hypothetical protein